MSADPRDEEVGRAPIRPPGRGELLFYALCRAISVGASRLYYPGRVVGREHLPATGPYVLAPVHRSNLDWLIVARVTRRRLRYIVKGEVWKRSRAVGRLLEMLGAFPVRRGSADREALNRALEVLKAGEPLVVFPEGTRNSGPSIGEMREGTAYLALRAGVPILPVGVAGTEQAMRRGAKVPRPARVRIVVGAPLNGAVGLEHSGRIARSVTHELSAEVRNALQGAFDQARSELSPLLGSRRAIAGSAGPSGDGASEGPEVGADDD